MFNPLETPYPSKLATLAAVFRLLAIASGPVGLLLWSPRTLAAIGLFASLSYLCQLVADLRRPL